MKKRIGYLIFIITSNLIAQKAIINIDNNNSYELGEVIKVSFELNSNKKCDSILMPNFHDFKIKKLSKSSSYINGKELKLSETRLYEFQTIDNGNFTIKSPIYYFGGKKIEATPVKVKVTASAEYREIKKEFKKYLNHLTNMEFEASMDYMLPEFFDIFPRSQMVKVMEQAFNIPEVDFKFKNPKITKIDKSIKIDKKYYSFMSYSMIMAMRFANNEIIDETKDEKTLRINLTILSLEKTFGSNNVNFKEKSDTFEIKSVKDAYAVSKNGKDDWKFLVIEKKQKAILEKLLPKELW